VEPSDTTMDNCYNIVLEHEDYTLGKAIEYFLYDRYFNGDKRLSFCAFKKAHPHDDYSIIQVAYKSNVNVANIMQDVATACTELIDVYLSIFAKM
jgi:DNA-directed RNA polymerase subunit L